MGFWSPILRNQRNNYEYIKFYQKLFMIYELRNIVYIARKVRDIYFVII